MLKEPVLESRPRQTAVEHADADQRARSNGVACSLQRHLYLEEREGRRVFATLPRCRKMLDFLCLKSCSLSETRSKRQTKFRIPSIQPRVANETGIENIFRDGYIGVEDPAR